MTFPWEAVFSALGALGGGITGSNAEEWRRNALVNVLNYLQALGGIGLDRFGEIYFGAPGMPGLMPRLFQTSTYGENLLFGSEDWGPGVIPQIQQNIMGWGSPESIVNLFRDSGIWWTPQMDEAINRGAYVANQIGDLGTLAQAGFAGGGWTPGWQNIRDAITPMMFGDMNQIRALEAPAYNLLDYRGQTPYTQTLQDAMVNAVNRLGMTANLQDAQNMAMSLLQSGGMTPGIQNLYQMAGQAAGGAFGIGGLTPTGALAEAAGLEGIIRGGQTPTSQALQALGLSRAAEDALMRPELAASIGADEAVRSGLQQAEAARRQALLRGGGPGSIVASGLQNEALSEFGDQLMRNRAEAIQRALTGQQQLALQQQAQGAQMAQAGLGSEAQRLGIFGDLVRGIEGVATSRLGTGLSGMSDAERLLAQRLGLGFEAVPAMQRAATDQMQALIQGGLGAGAQEIDRMNLGRQLMLASLQNRLAAGQLLTDAERGINQYALGLGNLANQALSQQMGFYQQLPQTYLAAGRLGLDRASNIWNAINQGLGQQLNLAQFYGNLYMQPFNILSDLGRATLGLTGATISALPGVFGNYSPSNPWTDFFKAAGSAAGSAFGNVINRNTNTNTGQNRTT